ncbi:MAG TPA: MFS transporter [Clostridiaceae bacterium]
MKKDAKVLILVSFLFTLAMGLSSIFINVFFFRETKSFKVIIIYNLMHYIFSPLTFILAGYLAKKKNGIWPLRIGLFLFSLFFCLILLFKSTDLIYPLGILFGIASGFYWLSYNTLSFDFTSMNNRDTFNGFNGSFCAIAAAVAPISAAFIISRFKSLSGYNIIFFITLVIFILLLVISLFIKCPGCSKNIDYKKIISYHNKEWNTIRLGTFFWGMRDVVIGFIINILIIETTGSEIYLGEFAFIAATISCVSFMLVQKFIKPKRRRLSLFFGASFALIAVLGIFFKISYLTLLLYVVIDAFFIPFFIIQLSSVSFNWIEMSGQMENRIEYIISKEIALNLGRITSDISLFILIYFFTNTRVINYFMLFIGFAPIVAAIFIGKLKKVLLKEG